MPMWPLKATTSMAQLALLVLVPMQETGFLGDSKYWEYRVFFLSLSQLSPTASCMPSLPHQHCCCLHFKTFMLLSFAKKPSCFTGLCRARGGLAWAHCRSSSVLLSIAVACLDFCDSRCMCCCASLRLLCCFSVLPLAHKTERPKSFQFRSAAVVFPIYLATR